VLSLEFIPSLLKGLEVTVLLTAAGALASTPMALAAALAKMSGSRLLRWIASTYVEVFRGTSALVQLFWFYFVLPLMGLRLEAFTVGVIVLALNTGAYGAEVVRGAVTAVPRSQREAALALNFSPRQTMWRIILPQALQAILPPAGNLMIELLKNTALVSFITITDLTFSAQILRAETLRTGEIFGAVLLMYFAVALAITACVRGLERWLARRHGSVAA
jgi:polar amino acid transport system permease protein